MSIRLKVAPTLFASSLLQHHTLVGYIATICTVSRAVASQHPNCCAAPPPAFAQAL